MMLGSMVVGAAEKTRLALMMEQHERCFLRCSIILERKEEEEEAERSFRDFSRVGGGSLEAESAFLVHRIG